MPVAAAVPQFGLVAPNEDTSSSNTIVNAINQNITALSNPPNYNVVAVAGDLTIPPHANRVYVLNKGSAAALTLAAPTTVTDDGLVITITSNTAFAHVLTATGLLQVGTVKTDVATFPAFAGGSLTLMAYGAKWNVIANNLCVFT